MVDVTQYRNNQVEQDLLNCGLTAESINSIRDTAVITRNGSQHVVPTSQQHFDEGSTMISNDETPNLSIVHQLAEQQQLFSRYKNYADSRITTLEKNMATAIEKLTEMHQIIATMKSNKQAQTTQVTSNANKQVQPEQIVQREKPVNKSIDRNNVAPVDVQVEKIFYCGDN